MTTTIPISGLNDAACLLATPGFIRPIAGRHAGSLLTGWLGIRQVGLGPFPVLTHWVTTTNFLGFHPSPRFRAYLGASTPWLGSFSGSRRNNRLLNHHGALAEVPVQLVKTKFL